MTLLSVCQGFALKVGVSRPSVVATSTEREHQEMLELANDVAEEIAQAHEWTMLDETKTLAGDGSTVEFALPDDYDRMPVKGRLWSSAYETPLTHISDPDKWLELEVKDFDYIVGAWTIAGGNVEVKPAMATGVTAKFKYVSNLIVSPNSGANKSAFDADNDSFRLDERLLKLGMIWQWKADKGLSYAQDMDDFETLKARLISKDRGARVVHMGHGRHIRSAREAYPGTLGTP